MSAPSIYLPSEFGNPSPRHVLTLDYASIGRLLNDAAMASGLSNAEIARRIGTTAQTVDQYRRGKRENPGVKWLLRYLQVCGGQLTVELAHAPL